jgi:uncharacterized BrkB/YihY/UPF0761 family membrane protein
MNNKRRMLTMGYGGLSTLPLFVVFIVMSVHYQVPALTILWSVFFGATLTSAIGLIVRARKEK